MKNFYIFTGVAVVVTILAVLFVPGVDDYVEPHFSGISGSRRALDAILLWR